MQEKLQNITLGGGAAATIVLPQAVTSSWPQLFASVAPLTSGTLPACTGVCGSCGGSCVGSLGALLWLVTTALLKGGNKHEAT